MPLKKKIIFSLILITFGLLFIELCAFIVLKTIGYEHHRNTYIYHPLRHHAYRPDNTLQKTHDLLPTDKYGYVKSFPEVSDPVVTVVLTGSSSLRSQRPFTGAEGTIPSRLQGMFFDKYGDKVRVQSLAIAGYAAFGEFSTLYEYLEKHRLPADVIVSVNGLFGINNFTHKAKEYLESGELYEIYDEDASQRVIDMMEGEFFTVLTSINQVLINAPFNTTRLIMHGVNSQKKKAEKRARKSNKDINWKLIQNKVEDQNLYSALERRESMNYNLIHEVATAYDVPYILFTLPAEYDWKNLPADKMNDKYRFQAHYKDKFYDVLKSQSNYNVVDLSGVFSSLGAEQSPYPKKDPVHFNDQGSEMIARELFEKIDPLVTKQLEKK